MYQSTHCVFIDYDVFMMQHYIEMSGHFGKLNTCVHAHERIAGSAVG